MKIRRAPWVSQKIRRMLMKWLGNLEESTPDPLEDDPVEIPDGLLFRIKFPQRFLIWDENGDPPQFYARPKEPITVEWIIPGKELEQ